MQLLLYGLKGVAAYADHAAVLGQRDPELNVFVYEALAAGMPDKDGTPDKARSLEDWLDLVLRCGKASITLTRAGKVWMCTGLIEQESHAWHVHCARGTVVVAGLGLGMYAYAAAMKPEVEHVIVADLSPEIIALMQASTDFERWPCREKLTLIEADALSEDFARRVAEACSGQTIDYLYADIWPNFPADEAPAQTAAMVRRLQPKAAGWWGQELALAYACRARGVPLDAAALAAWFAEQGVPLPPVSTGYVDFCRAVGAAYGCDRPPSPWARMSARIEAWTARR